ncbi:MAG TPA: hypothetical protein PL151_08825 [Phycisphaerae bacterium]|nr:hypothetical protein [Phycisphaerae bacterium]HQE27850.1 hypothetical protein [Phycisphaerae bacterium]
MASSAKARIVLLFAVGGPLLALIMGQGCLSFGPPVVVVDPPVVVELVNDSGLVVDPLLYVDPRLVYDLNTIMVPQNLVNIGPPMAPGEVVTVTLECASAGSLLTDADVVEFADGTIAQAGLLREGEHYFCGETVTFYYDPPVVPAPVTVELVNATSNLVDAFFWSDPGTLSDPALVAVPVNFVDVGEPLAPGEVVTLTLDCADAGTFLVDGDLLLVPAGTLPSANLILLNEGFHFYCGDIVSFYYEVDGAGGFFISADVNDVTIAP